MMLEGSNSSSAIAWVREDLDNCLETIRDNLETFAEDTSQRDSLRTVQDELERLNLTFLTMEQEGASILTDEMIAVGGHMLHNGKANPDESLSALTDAIIVLPSYLDRLQAGHEDLPILLLPILNELRATYDESLLSEGTLFAPYLDVIIPEMSGSEADAVASSDFGAWSRRIRSQYQAALLGWLKEQSKDRLLEPMQQVCETLYVRLGRNELRRLWWIARLIMEGLQDGSIDSDLPLRRLFARLDLTLKAMAEDGENGPSSDSITALSRALLFHAAQARPGSKATDNLRKRFKLEELIPDREALLRARGAVTGRDAELFRSIGEAIREELNQVKDTLDMELRTGRVEAEQRAQSLSSLQQLADTLHMLNLPVPAKAVEDLLPALQESGSETNMDLDSPLLVLAQKLLEVESILDSHIQLLGEPVEEVQSEGYIDLATHEQRRIISRLLDECVNSLHDVQDAIRKRLDDDTEADFGTALGHISGALHLASQGEVAQLTEKLERALNAELAGGSSTAGPADSKLEPLTDAVAALELYLAGCRDEQANSLRYLEVMHSRLEGLPEASASGDEVAATAVELPYRQAEEPAAAQVDTATETPPADVGAADIDPSMLGIFLEEFDSVVVQLRQQLPLWLDNTSDHRAMAELKRGFHTLKGSGRMVGAEEIGDFSGRFEELVSKLSDNKITPSNTLRDAVKLAVAVLDDLKLRLLGEETELTARGVKTLGDFARQLASGNTPRMSLLEEEFPASLLSSTLAVPDDMAATELTLESDSDVEVRLSTSEDKAAQQAETTAAAPVDLSLAEEIDPTLLQLMIGEVQQYLAELEPFVSGLASGAPQQVSKSLIRAVHTLAGTFSMAPLGQESQVARGLENYLEDRLKSDTMVSTAALLTLQTCLHRFHQRLNVMDGGSEASYPVEDKQLLAELSGLAVHESEAAEAAQLAAAAKPAVEETPEILAPQVEELAISGETPVVEAEEAAPEEPLPEEVAAEAEPVFIQIEEGSILSIFLEEATEIMERCDTLLNTWRDKLSDQKLVQNLQREIHTFKGGARMAGLEPLGNLSHAMETLLERIAANRMQATVASVQALEEGCDRLTVWVEQLQSGRMPQPGNALQRFEKKVKALSVPPLGEQATPEQPVEELLPDDHRAVEHTVVEQEIETATTEQAAVADAEAGLAMPQAVEAAVETAATPLQPISHKPEDIEVLEQTAREFHDIQERPAATAEPAEDGSSQAQIRVAAELMDSLVNYSGEISIYRSRIEQQMSSVRYNLKEVEATITRLSEQLRNMDIETEAQMMSRYQHASTQGSSEFDPLELDRFSKIQQLSRSLTESVSDLLNLQGMLDDSVRQADSLLTQQSRTSADLQAGLMQTRMTPFGSAAPRLRRVVRSAATETGKRARLQLRMAGSSDQLDRNVLERITAPLEHMLRNAVAHGIETPKERRKLKKPEEGEITVTVEAEATEFVIRVQDDGSGIDMDAVRNRAIERGMISKDDKVETHRLMEFIRDSGFSTSKTVTGLAGRGVGMDVVNNEIKQIGGSMEIHSESGKGTRFTIRIPFSLAVMQAIGVSVDERPFLIPLNSVAGVARMTPADYTKLAAGESPIYEFAGEKFPVLELEPLLDAPAMPLDSDNISLMMIRSGDRTAAFRVSGLQGHQEVVIKPVGPQISSIPGILGGTISGDGQVVIILDMGPLIRRGLETAVEPAQPVVAPREKTQKPLVMVVDDSITMRKVTSRVLESHSIEVVTAQDGLDAIERLHERVPDLMLLDIEMPRMDGYELAQHVRSDARLRHVPIVMITSRAGQKHRKKARESGANAYLTKPYQEAELVAQVGEMLNMELEMRRSD
jgi:chemosensory pili system protein ChpA (sensor histidine kinase/response regulator)